MLLERGSQSRSDSLKEEIYSKFDGVSLQWEKIENFVDNLSETVGVEHLMDEAEKLSRMVNQVSSDVIGFQEEAATMKKVKKFF